MGTTMNIVNEMGKVRCESSIVSLLRVWPLFGCGGTTRTFTTSS